MLIKITLDNATDHGGPCEPRLLLDALEHYGQDLHRIVDEGSEQARRKARAELITLDRVKTNFMCALVDTVEEHEEE